MRNKILSFLCVKIGLLTIYFCDCCFYFLNKIKHKYPEDYYLDNPFLECIFLFYKFLDLCLLGLLAAFFNLLSSITFFVHTKLTLLTVRFWVNRYKTFDIESFKETLVDLSDSPENLAMLLKVYKELFEDNKELKK